MATEINELTALIHKDNELFFNYVAVESLEITTLDQEKNCGDLLTYGRKAIKAAESRQKELLEPIKAAEKEIREPFKAYISRLELGVNRLNQALTAYHAKKENEAALLAAEALKVQRETGEVIEAGVLEPVKQTVRTHVGTVTYRTILEVTVIDEKLVPREFCDPNITRLRKAAEAGIRDIPGVLIAEKQITVARSS